MAVIFNKNTMLILENHDSGIVCSAWYAHGGISSNLATCRRMGMPGQYEFDFPSAASYKKHNIASGIHDNTQPPARMGRKAYRVSLRQPGCRNIT